MRHLVYPIEISVWEKIPTWIYSSSYLIQSREFIDRDIEVVLLSRAYRLLCLWLIVIPLILISPLYIYLSFMILTN